MIKVNKNDLLSSVCSQSKSSRYDYNKIMVESNSITVGSEGSFKESR